MGYQADVADEVSNALPDFLTEREFGVFGIDGLVALLRTEWDGEYPGDPWRLDFSNNSKHFRPEVAVIFFSKSLSGE